MDAQLYTAPPFAPLVIVPMTLREANDFVQSFHRHNGRTSRDGGKWAVGIEATGELVGVAIVGRPLSRHLDRDHTAEVLRTCTNERAPKGAVSKLYAACWRAWRAMGGRKLITYTLATESGASLRGAGWTIVHRCKGSPRGWSNNVRKREWHSIYGQQKFRWEMHELQLERRH